LWTSRGLLLELELEAANASVGDATSVDGEQEGGAG